MAVPTACATVRAIARGGNKRDFGRETAVSWLEFTLGLLTVSLYMSCLFAVSAMAVRQRRLRPVLAVRPVEV
jgi:hypothetical protein